MSKRKEARMARKFRSKKLSGKVRSADKLADAVQNLKICLSQTNYCLPQTNAVTAFHCDPFDPDVYVAQIAQLKADLKEAVKALDSHEKDVSATVKKASALALNELEAGLIDLLSEVEQRKRHRRDE